MLDDSDLILALRISDPLEMWTIFFLVFILHFIYSHISFVDKYILKVLMLFWMNFEHVFETKQKKKQTSDVRHRK